MIQPTRSCTGRMTALALVSALLAALLGAALSACRLGTQAEPAAEPPLAELSAAGALELHDVPRELPPHLAAAYKAIRPMDVYHTCKWLAHPRFAGRYPGTPEYRDVCEWAAGRFEAFGLRPGAPGYLQAYPSPYSIIEEGAMSLFLRSGGPAEGETQEIILAPGADFLPHLYSDAGDQRGPAVFVGWGISAPELDYDDYENVDVRGCFAVCFRGTPDGANRAFEEHDHHRRRMLTAKDKGALGLLYITDEVEANPNGDLIEDFLPAVIAQSAADKLLAPNGTDCKALQRELRETKKPRSFATGCDIRLSVRAAHHPSAEACNVAAWIEGADPELRREFVIVGGHLDHCGRHMGLVFAGADDNASGSACVMAIAEAFGRLKKAPKRSVLFALFGSEERGLIGSELLAATPLPLDGKVAAMINLDMEGEGDGVGAVVRPGFPELREATERADRTAGTVRSIGEFSGPPGVRGSDFAPFYNNGAPCIAFWSNGPHLHYHQPGDTIYRINPDMLADVSRLAFLTAYYLADR